MGYNSPFASQTGGVLLRAYYSIALSFYFPFVISVGWGQGWAGGCVFDGRPFS